MRSLSVFLIRCVKGRWTKSLDGVYLRQPIPKTIKTSDQVVIDFYKRTLGSGGIVKPVPMEELEKSIMKLSTGSEIDFSEFNL